MKETYLDRLCWWSRKPKHAPTGKTESILYALKQRREAKDSGKAPHRPGGFNQTELAIIIGEPEYVLRGMMDVLVDLHYVRMEKRGNSKVYYIL